VSETLKNGAGNRDEVLARSWEVNADAWTSVVREGQIPSRRAGTDDAVVATVMRVLAGQSAKRVLDVGCGEGWLARTLAGRGCDVVGVDASAPLIEHARALGGRAPGRSEFRVVSYAELEHDPAIGGGPYEVVVLNFAVLSEDVAPLFRALSGCLSPEGALVIQTVSPWTAAGDEGYRDGWREETFAGFGGAFAATMPWYFRTLGSWIRELRSAGFAVESLEEPVDSASGRILSLLLTCRQERS
jgi:2-polyprenyl-3-methyl-5-hydroxy-6-metoxy-1,4-benzoquinol methylase